MSPIRRRHLLGLLVERPRAGLGDAVVLRLAIALGALPRALDPALLLEAHERRIQRALIEHERVVGDLLEARREPVGVLRPHRGERPQDDQIERAVQEFDAFGHSTTRSSEARATRSHSFTGESSGRELFDRAAAQLAAVGQRHRHENAAELAALQGIDDDCDRVSRLDDVRAPAVSRQTASSTTPFLGEQADPFKDLSLRGKLLWRPCGFSPRTSASRPRGSTLRRCTSTSLRDVNDTSLPVRVNNRGVNERDI